MKMLFFISVFLFSTICAAQLNKGKLKPFIAPEGVFLFELRENFIDSQTLEEIEIPNDRIIGFGLNAGISINSHIAVVGYYGKEFLLDRTLDYQVYAIGINGVLDEQPNTWAGSLKIGGHSGDINEPGFLLRAGLGFKFHLFAKLNAQTEVLYSYQSIKAKQIIVNNMGMSNLIIESWGLRLIFH